MSGIILAASCDPVVISVPPTCLELLEARPGSEDGVYVIDPDLDAPGQPFETFCDMSTDGGGWTLVQRTVWDFAESSLLHTDYATFQGALLGSAAPGNAFRVPGSIWPTLQVTREHVMRHVPRSASGGDCGPLFYKATDGVWAVPPGGGAMLTGAHDPNALFNTVTDFSALDDGPSATMCVNDNLGVPWLYGSCCSTCPTYAGDYWNDGAAHPMSSRMSNPDLLGETVYTQCAPEQPRQNDKGTGGHLGVNIMEYYLR